MNEIEYYNQAKKIVEEYHQEHLLKFYERLSKEEQNELLKQINEIDFKQMKDLYESVVKKKNTVKDDVIEPIAYIDKMKIEPKEKKRLQDIGTEKIKQKKLAVVTMAGGQGTRLGHNGPKGTFELFPGKSLFSILCDTLKDACKNYCTIIPWYIMTSEENHENTIHFFEENNYFEYPKDAICFFKQGRLPMLNEQGKVILEEQWKIKQASDGNGSIFISLLKNGIIEDMRKKGVEWIFIGGVDNCLVQMVDALFIGLSEEKHVLAAAKSLVKANPKEKVGVFCKRNGKPSVIEYSEIPEQLAEARDENGELIYGESHIICNMFHISLIEKEGWKNLKYHAAFKKSNYINSKGEKTEATEPNSYKFESFIFDMFERVDDILIMRVKREEEFAPVKNKEGVDSPETARKLYLDKIGK